MGRWSDGNGTDTFYPAAAIVGHDPADILTHLEGWIRGNTYPNLHIHTGGGGIENLNTVPATIDEMLLQSFQGKIRPFANWPAGTSGRFGDLRAFGAFLVSSDIRANVVQYLRVISERGRPVTIVNPWPAGTMLRLYRNGMDAGPLTGAELTIRWTSYEYSSGVAVSSEDSEVDGRHFLPVYCNLPRACLISEEQDVVHSLVEAAERRNQELDHLAHVCDRLGFDTREHARKEAIEVGDEMVDAAGMQVEVRRRHEVRFVVGTRERRPAKGEHVIEKRQRDSRFLELHRPEEIAYDLERARIRETIDRPFEEQQKRPTVELSKVRT